MTYLFTAFRSALYASVFIGFFGWLALRLRVLDEAAGLGLPAWVRVPGGILMLLGASIALACVGSFVAYGRGTPAPFDPPTEFVAVGPYRWVRNPMYVGALTLLTGFGLWHRSVVMLALPPVLTLVVHCFVVFYEEPQLERRFGERYSRYLASVRRWLPRRPAGGESGS